MTTSTEVAKAPSKENALAVFKAANGLDPYLAHIRAEIDGFIPDVTTRKGREAIASIAHSVARSKTTLEKVQSFVVGENWEEFEAEAHRAKAAAIESLTAQLAKREKYEAEQVELARLRAEAEERAQKDREEQIRKDAAERATREAEENAQRERDADAQRVKDEQLAAEKRELELKLQAEKSERERVEATQRAEQAERDSTARAEAAAQAERQRQADEQAEQQRQAAARQADTDHKSKVLKAAKEAFVGMNISEELAKAIVLKIARGEVPNVTISF